MNKWMSIAIIVCVLLVSIGLVALVALEDNDDNELFGPLFKFCSYQLRSEVDSCTDWAFAFIEIYGEQPAECLDSFDSDSALLLMCISNIVEG